MYDILQLNDMLVPELRDIAEKIGLKGYKRLTRQELIYKILDQQALTDQENAKAAPTGKAAASKENGAEKAAPRTPAANKEEKNSKPGQKETKKAEEPAAPAAGDAGDSKSGSRRRRRSHPVARRAMSPRRRPPRSPPTTRSIRQAFRAQARMAASPRATSCRSWKAAELPRLPHRFRFARHRHPTINRAKSACA